MDCWEPERQGDSGLHGTEGVQIVELAVILPLLMVLLVGIFDFGNAFNLKQQLTNAARAAARFGASSPTSDLNAGGTPNSIISIRNFVDDSLTKQGINDCALTRTFGTSSAPTQLLWTFTATGNGCPNPGMTVIIDRSCCTPPTLSATVGGQSVQVVSTHVEISYPYQWQFGKVFGLLNSSATYANGVTQIITDSYVPNLD